MTRHLVTCLAIIAFSFVSPTPAIAATQATSSAVYDTVDAVEIRSSASEAPLVVITGIISGQSAPSEFSYQILTFSNPTTDNGARCDRLALLAMSKPGKFQLAMNRIVDSFGFGFGCKLIVRTP